MLKIQKNVILKPYTVFKIGGKARYFYEAHSARELKESLKWAAANNLPFFILAGGSNVLISDQGFNGLIIKNTLRQIKVRNSKVEAGAGVSMARVVVEAVRAGLTGFEWAIGIPGTVGGSVRGNAGCFGYEVKDVLSSVEVFDVQKFKSYTLKNKNCNFRYRDSLFKKNPHLVVLSASFKLKKGNSQKSQQWITRYSQKRQISQDIGAKCAGCIFKNVLWSRRDIQKAQLIKNFPELKQFSNQTTIPAAFLIDQLDLKERKVGDAQISMKHANYFINLGNAQADEVVMLIGLTKERIYNHYGILLEEEIQYVADSIRSSSG